MSASQTTWQDHYAVLDVHPTSDTHTIEQNHEKQVISARDKCDIALRVLSDEDLREKFDIEREQRLKRAAGEKFEQSFASIGLLRVCVIGVSWELTKTLLLFVVEYGAGARIGNTLGESSMRFMGLIVLGGLLWFARMAQG